MKNQNSKKVLICGGRNYANSAKVRDALNKIQEKYGISLIIQGGAQGADKLGALYALDNGIPLCEFTANWKVLGRRAGPVRNESMIIFGNPDCVVAFSGGAGTKSMIALAEKYGIAVWEVKDEAPE